MKRFLMLVAVATIAGAMYVAAAPGSRQTTAPTASQFAALKKQVASLTKKLKAVTKDETSVKKLAVDTGGFIVQCFLSQNAGVEGVTRFGDATTSTYGYLFQGTPGAPTTSAGYKTALDFDTSATPQAFLQAVDPSCVSSGGATASAQTHAGGGLLALHAEHAR